MLYIYMKFGYNIWNYLLFCKVLFFFIFNKTPSLSLSLNIIISTQQNNSFCI